MTQSARGSASRGWRTSALLLLASGCVPYQARPLDLAAHPAVYRARRLDDSRLRQWVARWGPEPAGRRWSPRQLALAALGLRTDVRRARAEWSAAIAGQASAGSRPQPGLESSVERAVSGSEGQSPWVVSLAGLFAIELGGKRGARLQQARARSATAEADLRGTAWRAVRSVYAAARALQTAEAELADAREEVAALTDVAERERARFREASLSSAELARTETEVQAARTEAAAVEAAVLTARAGLAGTLALPDRALDSLELTDEARPSCAEADSLDPDSTAALALTRRPELGRALAAYAAAEAGVRLAVAKQYPDLDLGPGFIWDQGVHRWTVALALPNLLGFRNRAPIREAEAQRSAAAAAVSEAQDAIVAETETARAGCRGATLERAAADSQVAVTSRAAELAAEAYQRGETSGLEPALARLAAGRAQRLRRGAERRLTAAAVTLQAALGGWEGGADRWPDPRRDELMDPAAPRP
jgi:cobalt-zinc-cadmium efflux system outer membrane protein